MMSWANSLPDFFVLFCFLNRTEMTIVEEWIRMQASGLISLVLMFEWFSKRTSLQMLFEGGHKLSSELKPQITRKFTFYDRVNIHT